MSKTQESGDKPRLLSIGEAAQASGLTARTIRYYEQIGLIPKARRRNRMGAPITGGDRVYDEGDVGRLRFIRHARLVDLSLAEIRELLGIADKAGCPSEHLAYSDVLNRHLRKIDESINHLLGLRTAVQNLLSRTPPMDNETCSWSTCSCMETDTMQSTMPVMIVGNNNQVRRPNRRGRRRQNTHV